LEFWETYQQGNQSLGQFFFNANEKLKNILEPKVQEID